MIPRRPPPARFLIFALLIVFLMTFLQMGIIAIAAEKLGLSRASAFLLLTASLLGSLVNLPLYQVKTRLPPGWQPPRPGADLPWPTPPFTGRTVVSVNVGGCLIPVTFSAYLIEHGGFGWGDAFTAVACVSAVCYLTSRPIPRIGIGMPVFVAPLAAAAVALFVNPEHSAPLAYVCGTLGVLVGADLLRLRDIRTLGAPHASIGGAGTFDGIFLTGIVAVLLA